MIAEIEEKIQRLQEEHVLNEITLGEGNLMYFKSLNLFVHISESCSRKRKLKSSEFLLLEKRKKPVTVTDILQNFVQLYNTIYIMCVTD